MNFNLLMTGTYLLNVVLFAACILLLRSLIRRRAINRRY